MLSGCDRIVRSMKTKVVTQPLSRLSLHLSSLTLIKTKRSPRLSFLESVPTGEDRHTPRLET